MSTSLSRLQVAVADLQRSVAKLNATTARKGDASAPRRARTPRPVQPARVALTTFGLTTAPGAGLTEAQRRAKADADALQARHDAVPEVVDHWAGRLSIAEMEALAAVGRFYAANGDNPVAIPRADLAAHLRTTPEEAERLLNKLAAVGAVRRVTRLHSAVRYVPVATPPEAKRARKTDDGRRADASALPRFCSALGVRAQ